MNRYRQQEGYGLGGIFRKMGSIFGPILKPVMKGIGNIGATVGTDLLQGLLTDVISGKNPKASIKSRGRQAGMHAVDLAKQKALAKLSQSGSGKSMKRKRSQTPARSQSTRRPQKKSKRSQSVKRSQIGGNVGKSKTTNQRIKKRKSTKRKSTKRKSTKRKPQKGKGKIFRNIFKKAFGVIKAKGLTAKQRKALPQKDIFG